MHNQACESCISGYSNEEYLQGKWFVAAILGIMALAAGISLWKAYTCEVIARDGVIYTIMARQWQQDPMSVIRDYDYHPGYPVAILGMHKVMEATGLASRPDSWDLAGQAVSLIAGLVALAGLCVWGCLTFNRWAALIAVLLLGVGKKWGSLSADVISDALAIAFQIWAIVLVLITTRRLADKKGSLTAPAIGAGLCAGLGYLVRPEAFLICVIGAAMATGLWCFRRLEWKRPALAIVLQIASAGLAAAPYFLAIGGFSKKKKLVELMGLSMCGSGSQGMLAMLSPGRNMDEVFLFISPFIESMHTAVAIMLFVWWLSMVIKLIRPGLAPRLARYPERLAGIEMMLYLGVMMVVFVGLYRVHHYLDYRHTMMVAVVLAPVAAQGALVLAGLLGRLGFWFSGKPRGLDGQGRFIYWLRVITVSGGLALAVGIAAHNLWEPLHFGKGVYRQAAMDMAWISPGIAEIVSDSPWVEHYLRQANPQCKVKTIGSYPASAEGIRKLISDREVHYVILPAQRKSRLAPSNDQMLHEGFRPWKEYTASNGDLLRVYMSPGPEAAD